MDHKEGHSKIDEGTLIPIGWLYKSIGLAIVLIPVIGWAYTISAKVEYTAESVKTIPQLQIDVATLIDRSKTKEVVKAE